MCGFSGFFDQSKSLSYDLAFVANCMAAQLQHRGPDHQAVWCDENFGVGLGHRRLSVLDLSVTGHQPKHSASGRYVIIFNGEIYNHQLIRKELSDYVWHGNSDTETLIAAIEVWGLERSLKKLVGMFAFAVWDKKEHSIILARDRFGEKPLYYGFSNDVLLFGSELKALKAHPAFSDEIDRVALSLYFKFGYIPTPFSIYKNIAKLPAGTWIKFGLGQDFSNPVQYWSVSDVAKEGQNNLFLGDEREAISELEFLLKQSVTGQMLSDVNLGAFLSGGVDSSMIAALMQRQSSKAIKTFTIGFSEKKYNEAEYACAISKYLGSEHTELYVNPEQLRSVIPKLPFIYDEPFADSSQIPTYLVAKLAKKYVTVSLSGDGGDELFGGYNRYISGASLWKKISYIPTPCRKLVSEIMMSISPQQWDSIFSLFLPSKRHFGNYGDKIYKLAKSLTALNSEQFYDSLVSNFMSSPVLSEHDFFHPVSKLDSLDFSHWMMMCDAKTYLTDDILCKVDRAAMSVGLETRAPYLDHRVFEFAWRLPLTMKIQKGQGKYILRQLLAKYLPRELIERPKLGFGVPLDLWLRGPLREWAESLLDDSCLRREGFLNVSQIRKMWLEHLSGRCNWQHQLWAVLMFQSWLHANHLKHELMEI